MSYNNKQKKQSTGSTIKSNQMKQSYTAAVSSSQTPNLVTPAPGLNQTTNNNNATGQIQAYILSLSDNDQIAHRTAYLQFLHVLSGSNVSMDLSDGTTVEGTYYTSTPFKSKDYLIAVKTNQPKSNNGNESDAQSIVLAKKSDFKLLSAPTVDLTPKSPAPDLQIDSSIRNKNISHLDGRNLEQVSSAWLQADKLTSLEGSLGDWNQFEVNKRLFNVASSYDENIYTKKLDISKMSKEMIADAERKAKEIEGSVSTNIHLMEERGQAQEKEIDEEDLYSGVIRETPTTTSAPEKPQNVWQRAVKPAALTTGKAVAPVTTSGKFKSNTFEKKAILEKPKTLVSQSIVSTQSNSPNVSTDDAVAVPVTVDAVVIGDIEVVLTPTDSDKQFNTSNNHDNKVEPNEIHKFEVRALPVVEESKTVGGKVEPKKPGSKPWLFNPHCADIEPKTAEIKLKKQESKPNSTDIEPNTAEIKVEPKTLESYSNSTNIEPKTVEIKVEIKTLESNSNNADIEPKTAEIKVEPKKSAPKPFSFNPSVADFVPTFGGNSSPTILPQTSYAPIQEAIAQNMGGYQHYYPYPVPVTQPLQGSVVYAPGAEQYMYPAGVPGNQAIYSNSPNHVPMPLPVISNGSPQIQYLPQQQQMYGYAYPPQNIPYLPPQMQPQAMMNNNYPPLGQQYNRPNDGRPIQQTQMGGRGANRPKKQYPNQNNFNNTRNSTP